MSRQSTTWSGRLASVLALVAALLPASLVRASDATPFGSVEAPRAAFANPMEADTPRMSQPEAPLQAARAPILMCTPPSPSAVVFAECCQKGSSTYVGKYEFCYCTPAKFASVCRLGPGASDYPTVVAGTRCVTLSTHPLWPKYNVSCQ